MDLGKSYGREKANLLQDVKKNGYSKKYILFPKKDNSWKLELEEFYKDILKKDICAWYFRGI